MKSHNVIALSIAIVSIIIALSCTKMYDPKIVGRWEQPQELNPEEFKKTTIWEFSEDNSVILYNDASAWVSGDTLAGQYSIESKKGMPYVKIQTENISVDGYYHIEKLNKKTLILQRRYFLDNTKIAVFLRKEFMKTGSETTQETPQE